MNQKSKFIHPVSLQTCSDNQKQRTKMTVRITTIFFLLLWRCTLNTFHMSKQLINIILSSPLSSWQLLLMLFLSFINSHNWTYIKTDLMRMCWIYTKTYKLCLVCSSIKNHRWRAGSQHTNKTKRAHNAYDNRFNTKTLWSHNNY